MRHCQAFGLCWHIWRRWAVLRGTVIYTCPFMANRGLRPPLLCSRLPSLTPHFPRIPPWNAAPAAACFSQTCSSLVKTNKRRALSHTEECSCTALTWVSDVRARVLDPIKKPHKPLKYNCWSPKWRTSKSPVPEDNRVAQLAYKQYLTLSNDLGRIVMLFIYVYMFYYYVYIHTHYIYKIAKW